MDRQTDSLEATKSVLYTRNQRDREMERNRESARNRWIATERERDACVYTVSITVAFWFNVE